MADKLKETFDNYTDVVLLQLRNKGEQLEEPKEKKGLLLLRSKARELQSLVEELEGEEEFHLLVEETRSSFSGSYHGEGERMLKEDPNKIFQQYISGWKPSRTAGREAAGVKYFMGKFREQWETATKQFFRRSGYYLDIFEGRIPKIDTVFQSYCEAFERRECTISYLAPIEYVDFAGPSMDFGTFQIRKFSSDELRSIFSARVNDVDSYKEVFYPQDVDVVEVLQYYWFIYSTKTTPARKIGAALEHEISIPWEREDELVFDPDYVTFGTPIYPSIYHPFESILQQIMLYDWEKKRVMDFGGPLIGESGFRIPFVLDVHDDLLSTPISHSLWGLDTHPSDFDDQTGKSHGQEPTVYIHLNTDETASFKAFVQRMGDLLNSLKAIGDRWQFLDVALNYFVKASFDSGLEQLLWHLIVLEALLGENAPHIEEQLARRIALILGKSQEERKVIKKQFKELYEFRSNLVHGDSFPKKVHIQYFQLARNLARRTLVWFLHYLGSIQDSISQDHAIEDIPTRKDILLLLDLEKSRRLHLSRLISSVPEGFPHVHGWEEYN